MDHMDTEKVNRLAEKYGLTLLILFGSRARGNARPTSDYDVAYVSDPPLRFEKECELNVALTPIFGSENIDIVNLHKATPLLLFSATDKCKVLYARNPLVFPSLRAYAYKKYLDTQPLYQMKFDRLLKIYGLR